MEGSYERLVGCSKMALRKSIGRRRLTMLQLQKFYAEPEAILNLNPLVMIREELSDGKALTAVQFLSSNTKTGIPQLGTEEEIKTLTTKKAFHQ